MGDISKMERGDPPRGTRVEEPNLAGPKGLKDYIRICISLAFQTTLLNLANVNLAI